MRAMRVRTISKRSALASPPALLGLSGPALPMPPRISVARTTVCVSPEGALFHGEGPHGSVSSSEAQSPIATVPLSWGLDPPLSLGAVD